MYQSVDYRKILIIFLLGILFYIFSLFVCLGNYCAHRRFECVCEESDFISCILSLSLHSDSIIEVYTYIQSNIYKLL